MDSPKLTSLVLAVCLVSCGSPTRHLQSPSSIAPYSAAVLAGDFCIVAGKIGERGQGFAHEVETCIDSIESELARAGLTLADAVQATVYLTDMNRYEDFNAIYGKRFPAPYPARVCVAVAALPKGAQVEVQVTARR